ncbi:MAG: hypothetical protein HXS42_10390 [Theionarchaea archaeon]|nr:hypothetical protein [Theionarchaea archaeon]
MREATITARTNQLGIWQHIDSTVLPMELRFLTRREPPSKHCVDLDLNLLYPPYLYFKVPIENRLFFYRRDVLTAVAHKFRPSPECDEWQHKV